MAGIYIHIPFCKQACNYCNFHFSTSLKMKEDMLKAIHLELQSKIPYLEGQTIETIYLGGGTPSLLSQSEIMHLFDAINKSFPNQDLKEVTMEANPDDLDYKYIQSLANTPVSRFSLGVQSFLDEDLQYMNRAHNASQADYAIKVAQDAGFDNISIDLIYGTPGLTDQKWLQNVRTAVSLNIPHISSYALTVEPKTALAHAIEKGKAKPVNESQSAQQFELLMEKLIEAGYQHYEISNFALPDRYAVHNTNYWSGKHYAGVGPSAHSFNGHSRQWNIANNALYISGINQDKKPPFEIEELSKADQLNEYIMTSMRTMWGLDFNRVTTLFGSSATDTLLKKSKEYIYNQQATLTDNHLVLTSKGKLYADGIAGDLFFDDFNL